MSLPCDFAVASHIGPSAFGAEDAQIFLHHNIWAASMSGALAKTFKNINVNQAVDERIAFMNR